MSIREYSRTENESASEWIERLAGGFRVAQIVLVANRLGLFDALGNECRTTRELAARLQADERGLRILCRALAATGLVVADDGGWRNSDAALETLTVDAPQSRAAILRHQAQLYERWGRLADCVRAGAGVDDDAISPEVRCDENEFALAMADVGRSASEETAAALDLAEAKTLLDLGGGPGLYAIAMARRYPQLRATVFDTPNTLAVARENIERAGLSDRVAVRAGDLFEDDYGGPYDSILLSNVIHIYSEDNNRLLLERSAMALNSDGWLCVKDFALDGEEPGADWAALFAVNMLVSTDGGDCYYRSQIESWVAAAGLRLETVKPLAKNSHAFIARKA